MIALHYDTLYKFTFIIVIVIILPNPTETLFGICTNLSKMGLDMSTPVHTESTPPTIMGTFTSETTRCNI